MSTIATSQRREVAYFQDAFDTSNPGLRAYMGIVREGQPRDYTVKTFARGIPTSALLTQWRAVLESISTEWPTLYEYENDLANKVGPMSITLPLKERIKDIDSYYEGILLPSKPVDGVAVDMVKQEFMGLRGLRVRNQAHTLSAMKVSTNSGSPFFTKRRQVISLTYPCDVWHRDLLVAQKLDHEKGYRYAAAVLGWRGQEGGPSDEDVKQRVVWMFPFAVNLRELQVYQPLIEGAQKLRLVPAWISMDEVDRRITAMFDSKAADDLVVCTDFSKFDQHFNSTLQGVASSVLSWLLVENEASQAWLSSVFPIKYMIPLAYDWERIRFGRHGMGSGSGGTNADETIAHRSLQYEAALKAGAKLNPYSQCLGDDGVLTYPGITVDQVVAAYTSHGLEMNPDKQYASTTDCTYLRRWHHKEYRTDGVCVGVYSTMRALGRLRYLERRPDPDIWDERAFALRELSILENCKWHPLKELFVQQVLKWDQLRLGLAIPGFMADVKDIAEEFVNKGIDILGYTKSLQAGSDPTGGIDNWWIVKYLRSLE